VQFSFNRLAFLNLSSSLHTSVVQQPVINNHSNEEKKMNATTKVMVANLTDDLPNLQEGTSSLAVAILQQLLNLEGYANLPITGYFGNDTQTAVLDFQQVMGLSQDGVVGPDTWGNLVQASTTGN
jgi:peptidoglycan hydrolase-like protein with peptidoglycan-binding domain